nr:amidohydrolase family protein [Siccirubricoccus soli]
MSASDDRSGAARGGPNRPRHPFRIIDAQVHIWGSGEPSGLHRKTPVFTAEELLKEMDEAGVDAGVIHPPMSWDPSANDIAEAAAAKYPDRFAVLGQVDLTTPETSRPLLHGWRNRPGQKGLRFPLVRKEQRDWHSDGTMEWLWPVAAKEGLPVALLAGRFLPSFRRIAEAHPDLRLIIDHCGLMREAMDEAALVTLDDLVALAKLPNVAVKATGAPGYSTQPYPYRNIHDALHRTFDAFGPQRFFWGTDITRMPCSYRQCVTMFTEELPWLKGQDLEWVMGRGIAAWIGWDYRF